MTRRFLLLVILLISSLIYLLWQIPFSKPSSRADLRVLSVPEKAKVKLDGDEKGVTPWESQNLDPGEHLLEISLQEKAWTQKIYLAPGKTTVAACNLGTGAFFGSAVISYKKIAYEKGRLSVTTIPSQAELFLDQESLGKSPLIKNSLTIGNHELKVEKEGYLPHTSPFSHHPNFLTQLTVDLFEDPFWELEELSLLIQDQKQVLSSEEIRTRDLWEAKELEVESKSLNFTSWANIRVFAVQSPPGMKGLTAKEWLLGMQSVAQNHWNLPDIPFAYLITSDGNVYQGLGVRDLDFSSLPEISKLKNKLAELKSGDCPVGYLNFNEERQLSSRAQETLDGLSNYLKTPLSQKAELASPPEDLNFQPGQKKSLTLTYKNLGEGLWFKTGDKKISLVKGANQESLGELTSDFILPQGTGQFKIELTPPWKLGEFTVDLALLDHNQGQIIPGSSYQLKGAVVPGDSPWVEITQTSTGFLNVRSTPALSSTRLTQVYPGEKYILLEEQPNWGKIKIDRETEGWIYTKYTIKHP